MSKDIFLAPCVNAAANKNFNQTVLNGIPVADIPDGIRNELPDPKQKYSIWGTGNESTWKSCKKDDLLLFYPKSGEFTHAANVIDTFKNVQFSKQLWPNFDEEPWEWIIFLEDPSEISLDINTFTSLFGYSDSFAPQGFTRIAEGPQDKLKQKFGSLDNFEAALFAEKDLTEISSSETNNDISLQSKFQEIVTNYSEVRQSEPFDSDNRIYKVFNQLETDFERIEPVQKRANLEVRGSAGRGNWATIPWISLYDRRETETIQEGVYCVYLFREDMSGFYLTLMQGVSEYIDEYGRSSGRQKLKDRASRLRNYCGNLEGLGFQLDNNIDLHTDHDLGIDYEYGTIGYKFYDADNVPHDQTLIEDLENLLDSYDEYLADNVSLQTDEESRDLETLSLEQVISRFHDYIESKGFYFEYDEVKNFVLSLKTKPFVILAGISGTGKTKLAQLFAEFVGHDPWLISVKPNWTDNSDLLGYQNLQDEFQKQTLTEVLIKANKNENEDKPHFVILDEMNLARVEHYFSDFLSKMETCTSENGKIESDPIFEDEFVDNLKNHEDVLRSLRLKDNIYIIGTVNMDETTHPFSRKVLDRANSLEFNDVELNQINSAGDPPQRLQLSNDVLKPEYVRLVPELYNEHQEFFDRFISQLETINEILRQGDFQVGYRVRDELCLYIYYADQENILSEEKAFDFQLKQKILPRLQGSTDTISDILEDLYEFTTTDSYSSNASWSDNKDIQEELSSFEEAQYRYPRSARKILRMQRRYLDQTFTSFWV